MALWLRPPSLCKLFIFLTCVVSSSGNMMGMDCWSLVFELNDCMSYMKDGSNEINPDPTCCLIVEILLKADVECICIKNSVQLGVKLDLTRALSLTSACNFSPTKCPLIVQTGSATPVITSSNVVKSLSTVTTTPDELEKVFSYSGEAKSLSTIAAAPDQNRERSLINVFTVVAPALAPNPVTVQKRHAASVFPYSNLFKSLSTIATTLDHLVSLTVQKEPATLVFPYSNAVKSLSTIAAAPYQTQEKSLISIKLEKSLTTRSLVDVFIIDAPALAPMPSLDDAPVPGGNNSHATLGLGLGLGIAISVIALVCIGIFFLRRRRRNNLNRLGLKSVVPPLGVNNDEPFASPAPLILNREPPNFEVVIIPPKNFKFERTAQPQYSSNPSYAKTSFMYDELALATNNFSDENLLGSGGFGNVHKGVLKDGTEVAVKKLKLGSRQGEREFQSEVETVSRVHHRHLVSLVGYCTSGTERLLVYEFVPNDTLEFHLHEKGRPPISWETRVKIALGSANGLAYLHEDCQPKIIHRDIKSSNILLDENFEAKVADFGLARFYLDVETHVSTRVMGTFGYLAPEYALTGKVTDKSDVFSFGVVLLELITGRRPIDKLQAYLDDNIIDWARPLLTQALEINNFDKLVDSRLPKDYNHVDMTRMVACASACVRHLARRRPSMNQVVCALEGIISLEDLNEGSKHGTISESH